MQHELYFDAASSAYIVVYVLGQSPENCFCVAFKDVMNNVKIIVIKTGIRITYTGKVGSKHVNSLSL